jgi:hypothetical protein
MGIGQFIELNWIAKLKRNLFKGSFGKSKNRFERVIILE